MSRKYDNNDSFGNYGRRSDIGGGLDHINKFEILYISGVFCIAQRG